MNKETIHTQAEVAPDAVPTLNASPEPRNVLVEVLQTRTEIRGAIVASGRCDFPLTASEAKALETLGKVRILGIE